MHAKWHISTLLLLSIYLGLSQEQVAVPNQEIVLEFVDTNINKIAVENTISQVKKQLLQVGITHTVVKKSNNGTLKISYYSDAPINNIKKVLTGENTFALNQPTDFPEKKENSSHYHIDVHQLTGDNQISNSDYNFIFEIKYTYKRSNTVHTFAIAKKTPQHNTTNIFKVAFQNYKNTPFTKDRTSYKEPEVRAGPQNFIS